MSNSFALVSIDMQNDFVLPGAPFAVGEAMSRIENMSKVLHFFRSKNLPVVHVCRRYRTDGSDVELVRRSAFLDGTSRGVVENTEGAKIVQELSPSNNEYVIVKPRFSAFFATELDLLLRRLGIHTIVLIGVNTANCIRSTAYDGISLDYDVVVLADATAAQTKAITEYNLQDMARIGIATPSFEEFRHSFNSLLA